MFKFLAVAGFAALSAFGWYTSQPDSAPQAAARLAPQAAMQPQAAPQIAAQLGPGFTITYNAPGQTWTTRTIPINGAEFQVATTQEVPRVTIYHDAFNDLWWTGIGVSSGGMNKTPYGTFRIGAATVTVGP